MGYPIKSHEQIVIESAIFKILKKTLNYKTQEDLLEEIKVKNVKNIGWELAPLEDNKRGEMQYRLIAKLDGRKFRVFEKQGVERKMSFSKDEAEYKISYLMFKYQEIEQQVKVLPSYRVANIVFEKKDVSEESLLNFKSKVEIKIETEDTQNINLNAKNKGSKIRIG